LIAFSAQTMLPVIVPPAIQKYPGIPEAENVAKEPLSADVYIPYQIPASGTAVWHRQQRIGLHRKAVSKLVKNIV